MNIYLIGYRCTGKTSVGKLLSQALGWQFIDMDVELTRRVGMSISEFVDRHGWQDFRRQEESAVRQIRHLKRHVVATGGGVVLSRQNVIAMKASGMLIWLKASPGTIKDRIRQDAYTKTSRPALTSKGLMQEIEETLSSRIPHYQQAMDFFIDTEGLDVESVCRVIIRKLPVYLDPSALNFDEDNNTGTSRIRK